MSKIYLKFLLSICNTPHKVRVSFPRWPGVNVEELKSIFISVNEVQPNCKKIEIYNLPKICNVINFDKY